jgi:hypothetical protein
MLRLRRDRVNDKILSRKGEYVIATLGKWFGLYKGDTLEYDTHIVYSPALWVVEEEMDKLCKDVQLSLF